MRPSSHEPTREVTIVAQDPGVRVDGKILTARVRVPYERLAPGPRGYRLHVVDYDASTRTLYKPWNLRDNSKYRSPGNPTILNDPGFHAQNVYAIAMRILTRFEQALGRHVAWGFDGHQLKIVPHAFADANAFYSARDESILFGYFPAKQGKKRKIFSCLSHDVVAHETAHALLDGLRGRFTDPSSPDQAAFHEGFADIVALLSVLSLREVVESVLRQEAIKEAFKDAAKAGAKIAETEAAEKAATGELERIPVKMVDAERLRRSVLLGLAEEMGTELSVARGSALRRSVRLEPSEIDLEDPEFQESHRRGELLVAAMMRAFIAVWRHRLDPLIARKTKDLDLGRVAEEAADAADYLLTMTIRALDYCPPIHLDFGDYLSALLTADYEIHPDDSRYRFRAGLKENFGLYGILPTSRRTSGNDRKEVEEGVWRPPRRQKIDYNQIFLERLSRDPDEMFRFVWENRDLLKLREDAYTVIESLRPCLRTTAVEGVPVREIVAECIQMVSQEAGELKKLDRAIKKPADLPDDTFVTLKGGVTLIFDDFGQLKYAIGKRIDDHERQSTRLAYLHRHGQLTRRRHGERRFATHHRMRARPSRGSEGW